MKQRIITALFSLAFATTLLAHLGAEHITGFVKTVDRQSLTVETTKHETVTVLLTTKTQGMKSAVAFNIQELKPGERVVIHAKKNAAGALEAIEVDWGPKPKY
jgi:hypothetical protein